MVWYNIVNKGRNMNTIIKPEQSTVNDKIYDNYNICASTINQITSLCDHQKGNIENYVFKMEALAKKIQMDNGNGEVLAYLDYTFLQDIVLTANKLFNTEKAFRGIDSNVIARAEVFHGIKKTYAIEDLKIVNKVIPLFKKLCIETNKLTDLIYCTYILDNNATI